MSKQPRKRFGLSSSLNQGLSETITMAEGSAGQFRHISLTMERVELDPDNPRKLSITRNDVLNKNVESTLKTAEQKKDYEALRELSVSILQSGVLNPIVVYKHKDNYRVVAGERRFLASIMANKETIEARVYNKKPSTFDLKLVQWSENNARQDLRLYERIKNLEVIITEYQVQHPDETFTGTKLHDITGLSERQSQAYLKVIRSDQTLMAAINEGGINSLEKATLIQSMRNKVQRQAAIEACLRGATISELKQLMKAKPSSKNKPQQKGKRGRAATRVNLGHTEKPELIKTLVETVTKHADYKQHAARFKGTDWKDFAAASAAFKQLLELIDRETSN